MDHMFESISQKSQYSHDSVNKPIKHRKKWEFNETKKYYEFLLVNRNILQLTEKKQKQRVYNRMSQHVGSRSTHQCRSHHQKVMKRHSSIDKFISMFRAKMISMGSKDPALLEGDRTNQNQHLNGTVNKPTKLEQSPEVVQLFIDEQQQSIKQLYLKKTQGNVIYSQQALAKKDQFYMTQNYYYEEHSDNNVLPMQEKTGDLSGIGIDQININRLWTERVLQNSLNQERFIPEHYPSCSDDYCCPHGDNCRCSHPPQPMAQKIQDSTHHHQPIFHPTPSQNNNKRQQQFPAPRISPPITQKDNPNCVNSHVGQKKAKSKTKQIKKRESKQQDYRIWFQKERREELQECDQESNEEEIQMAMIREVTIKVLKEFGIITEKDTQNQKQQTIPNPNSKPQQQNPLHSQSSLFPHPIPIPFEKDLEDRRRTDDSYSSLEMQKTGNNEPDLHGWKRMEKQQRCLLNEIDMYHPQQALFSERQNWQEFPPGLNKTPTNFQNFPEFQDPIRSSHFWRFYSNEHQILSFPGTFPPCNNPHCLQGCNPKYMQTISQQNQHNYQPSISHNSQHYNFQRRQKNSSFPPRGRCN